MKQQNHSYRTQALFRLRAYQFLKSNLYERPSAAICKCSDQIRVSRPHRPKCMVAVVTTKASAITLGTWLSIARAKKKNCRSIISPSMQSCCHVGAELLPPSIYFSVCTRTVVVHTALLAAASVLLTHSDLTLSLCVML